MQIRKMWCKVVLSALVMGLTVGGITFSADAAVRRGQLSPIQKAAKTRPQIIFVAAEGNMAAITMYNKTKEGQWVPVLQSPGYIGKNGLGKTKEGDVKTPIGVYDLGMAFGIKDNPGTALSYTKVTDKDWWVGEWDTGHYNKFMRSDKIWKESEHLMDYPIRYAYAIYIDYNHDCIPGKGSGIFLHCWIDKPTGGCVSVPEHVMVDILKQVQPKCVISIDTVNNISKQINELVLLQPADKKA